MHIQGPQLKEMQQDDLVQHTHGQTGAGVASYEYREEHVLSTEEHNGSTPEPPSDQSLSGSPPPGCDYGTENDTHGIQDPYEQHARPVNGSALQLGGFSEDPSDYTRSTVSCSTDPCSSRSPSSGWSASRRSGSPVPLPLSHGHQCTWLGALLGDSCNCNWCVSTHSGRKDSSDSNMESGSVEPEGVQATALQSAGHAGVSPCSPQVVGSQGEQTTAGGAVLDCSGRASFQPGFEARRDFGEEALPSDIVKNMEDDVVGEDDNNEGSSVVDEEEGDTSEVDSEVCSDTDEDNDGGDEDDDKKCPPVWDACTDGIHPDLASKEDEKVAGQVHTMLSAANTGSKTTRFSVSKVQKYSTTYLGVRLVRVILKRIAKEDRKCCRTLQPTTPGTTFCSCWPSAARYSWWRVSGILRSIPGSSTRSSVHIACTHVT